MTEQNNVRWGWLKLMYWYTIIGAGGFGLAILFVPKLLQTALGFPEQDVIVFGVFGSVYSAFGLLSILGLGAPLKFVPLLILQLCYKVIWLFAVAVPLFISGSMPLHGILLFCIFLTYIIGDLIAIPFSYIFAGSTTAVNN